jgi:hypothetical protein
VTQDKLNVVRCVCAHAPEFHAPKWGCLLCACEHDGRFEGSGAAADPLAGPPENDNDRMWFVAWLFARVGCVLFGHRWYHRVGECQPDGSLRWGHSCGMCEAFKPDKAPGE